MSDSLWSAKINKKEFIMAKKAGKNDVKAKSVKKDAPKSANNKIKALQAELTKLSKEINEEGLTFLVTQAKTIINNIKIDKQNKEKEGAAKKFGPNDVKIIEGENKANFIIQVGKERKFFSRDDFRNVVKVAQSGDSVVLLGTQLFNWMMRERKDFLIDNNIQKTSDPRLAMLIRIIKSKYKVKK